MRVGLAGYGLGGRVFHRPLIEAVDGLELGAVLTSRPVEGVATVREMGELIRVTRFESRFERFRPEPADRGWKADPREGGALLDFGAHLVDQALVLFGPVEHVYAEVRRVRPGDGADDDDFLALRHAGGV